MQRSAETLRKRDCNCLHHCAVSLLSAGAATATPSRRTLQINDAPADPTLFVDGFETGNASRWSAVVP